MARCRTCKYLIKEAGECEEIGDSFTVLDNDGFSIYPSGVEIDNPDRFCCILYEKEG